VLGIGENGGVREHFDFLSLSLSLSLSLCVCVCVCVCDTHMKVQGCCHVLSSAAPHLCF
jgi:hypothetical protein